MKKNSKYIVLTAAIALCAGSSLPFLAGSSTLNPERDSVKSEVPYCVTSPSVPDKITFAGQAIDLLRYDHRERMDRELMSFTYMHSTTMLMVKRANRYFPVIEPILKANGLPDDFKYLAVIESNLNPLAKSPAGAAGLWQFMPATGREFGLEVNSNIDERYHIEKETKAACKYLKVGAGMYTISIAATLLTLAGLELLSLIFKSIGMKSSVITFSTSSKEILPQVSRRFNSKDYLVVSYNLDRQVQGEYTNYQVTMVIKSKKSYDEGYLLQLMQEFPEVTVEKIE